MIDIEKETEEKLQKAVVVGVNDPHIQAEVAKAHIAELVETGIMLNPPTRELPPPMPEELDAPTDLQTPDDEPPTEEEIEEEKETPRI